MEDRGKTSFVVLVVLMCTSITIQFCCNAYIIIQASKFDKQYSIAKEYKSQDYDNSISLDEAINQLEIIQKRILSFLYKSIISGGIGFIISIWQLFSGRVYKLILSDAYESNNYSEYTRRIMIAGKIISIATIISIVLGEIDVYNSWKEVLGYVKTILLLIGALNI